MSVGGRHGQIASIHVPYLAPGWFRLTGDHLENRTSL